MTRPYDWPPHFTSMTSRSTDARRDHQHCHFWRFGDLTSRKLLPALFNLWLKYRLPQDFHIVGMARSAFSDDQFRKRMWDGVVASGGMESRSADWERFLARGHYCKGDLALPQDMARLKVMLEEAERGQSPSTAYFSSQFLLHCTNLPSKVWARPDWPRRTVAGCGL